MIDLADRCSKQVYSGSYGGHPCQRNGILEHEGLKYCKQHHPPTVEAYLAARDKRWQEKWDAQDKASEAQQLARSELVRKAAAYDRLMTCLDAGGGGMGRIREILEGEK
jgi:hypothetical protein